MVFVIRCLYSAVSFTLVREQRFIRIIIIIIVVVVKISLLLNRYRLRVWIPSKKSFGEGFSQPEIISSVLLLLRSIHVKVTIQDGRHMTPYRQIGNTSSRTSHDVILAYIKHFVKDVP